MNHALTLPNYKLPTYCSFLLSKSSLILNNNYLKLHAQPSNYYKNTCILLQAFTVNVIVQYTTQQKALNFISSYQAFYFFYLISIFSSNVEEYQQDQQYTIKNKTGRLLYYTYGIQPKTKEDSLPQKQERPSKKN